MLTFSLGGSKKLKIVPCVIFVMLNIGSKSHPIYVKLSMLKIKERHDLNSLIMTFKILKNYAPGYLSRLFTAMHEVRERPTRAHPLYLQAPRVGRGVSAKSFMVRCYRLWNDMPQTLWDSVSIIVLKSCFEKIC